MLALDMKKFRNTLLVVFLLFIFTLTLNLIQAAALTWKLTEEFNNFRSSTSIENREEILDRNTERISSLAKSIETPWIRVPFAIAGQKKNLHEVSNALKAFSRVLDKTAPLVAEVSTLKVQSEIIERVDANRSMLVLSASDMGDFLTSIDSIDLKRVPFLASEDGNLEERISLANQVWSENYESIGAWSEALGAREPKRYFVALQNSAQARGTGGMPGTFAIVEINKGNLSVLQTGTNAELRSAKEIPIKVPAEFREIYGEYPAGWNPSNLSPHFPYAAKIWLALWRAQTNEKLDGAIAVDPFVLASLLKVTGDIEVDGRVLTPENTVDELLSKAYVRYENDNRKRKDYLADVAFIFGKKLQERSPEPLDLASALLKPLSQRRILIFSSDIQVQQVLQNSAVSGSLDFKSKNDYRAIVINTSGNKMDYYLSRRLKIETKNCNENETEVTFSLLLDVNSNTRLPDYVNGRKDLGRVDGVGNSHGLAVLIFGPKGSTIIQSKSDQPKSYLSELGRPVWLKYADLKPKLGQDFKVTFAGGKGRVTSSVQPLVKKQKTEILDNCQS